MKLKKLFNGIIAVFLTAFLITGSFPAYLLNASAANEMSVVTIADISTPYPDTRPDYTAVYCDGVQKPDIPDFLLFYIIKFNTVHMHSVTLFDALFFKHFNYQIFKRYFNRHLLFFT